MPSVEPLHLGVRETGVVVGVGPRRIELGRLLERRRGIGHVLADAERETTLEVRLGERIVAHDRLIGRIDGRRGVGCQQRDRRPPDVAIGITVASPGQLTVQLSRFVLVSKLLLTLGDEIDDARLLC